MVAARARQAVATWRRPCGRARLQENNLFSGPCDAEAATARALGGAVVAGRRHLAGHGASRAADLAADAMPYRVVLMRNRNRGHGACVRAVAVFPHHTKE